METGPESGHQLRRGVTIGRYVVLGLVGRGAMGDVYSAYDPDLDRKVAIKLLRVKKGGSTGGLDGKTRLLREAQATARLSHPNVVVVHDVGTYKDGVFIAMEFIEGGTLTFWLNAQPREWREILRTFLAAGRGLQHAHEGNLVHRDFKPDNVMVRQDGEVRVMDFGLVRYIDLNVDGQTSAAAETPPAPPLDATMELARPPAPLAPAQAVTKLTQTGAMLGTPAYMAPEQFVGQTVDARSDQFSFCVALYEALFGARPFDGTTMAELTGNVVQGHVKPLPQRSPIPVTVWRTLRRGLSVAPGDRFPSMAELLADLGRHAHPPRTGLVTSAVVAAAVVIALVGGLVLKGAGPHPLCAAPTDRFEGVWESSPRVGSRRASIEFAFRSGASDGVSVASTGRSTSWAWSNMKSRASFHQVSQMLDKYVADWLATYKEACEATHYRRDQSTHVLDLRMSCLNDRFGELRALSEALVMPTSEIIEDASQAVASLGSLNLCSSVAVLGSAPARSALR
ncbi:MAG TPA: serine/threonine-protein kinase [Polyangia bacterium]|nr:serine/threonine-protein kinase [Polyangia bacterium]